MVTSCNSLRCEFTHPDNMSEKTLEICKALAQSPEVNTTTYKY